jgi:dihydroorotate dehydrogenase
LAIQKKNNSYSQKKPILLKIAPDLSNDELLDIIDVVKETSVDGIIATNTTLSRKNLNSSNFLKEQSGGLSGKPIAERSNEVIRFIHENSNGTIPIIGVGGIMSPKDAIDKIKAGASLVQLYTGFVYGGPGLVKQINQAILNYRLNQ